MAVGFKKRGENRNQMSHFQLACLEQRRKREALADLEKATMGVLVLRRPTTLDEKGQRNWFHHVDAVVKAAKRSGQRYEWNETDQMFTMTLAASTKQAG